jgi:hypothetical protein
MGDRREAKYRGKDFTTKAKTKVPLLSSKGTLKYKISSRQRSDTVINLQ